MNTRKSFASDNNAGVHPAIFEALAACNKGHVVGYGDDPYTIRAIRNFKNIFSDDIDVFFVYGGTGANVLGLSSMLLPHQAVLCAETAHINVDECGAPEKFSGSKLITLATSDGKINIEQAKAHLHTVGFEHHVQPKVISITQPTELGTIYSVEEVQTIADFAHDNDMLLHMDGARIANAAAALDLPFKTFTADAGVDVLSFGGTKNGLMFGEAVIFFNRPLAGQFKYTRKQGMQLHSKMRYMAAQFDAYLSNDLWLNNARSANRMAALLHEKLQKIPQIQFTQEVQTNGLFAIVPHEIIEPLQNEYFFYVWDDNRDEIRWMTSFDTDEQDIEQFVATVKKLLEKFGHKA